MKRSSSNPTRALVAALAVLALGASVRADNVRTRAGIGYAGKVTDLGEEGLVVNVGGTKRSVPLADVLRIEVDDFPDLGKAEASFAEAREGGGKAQAQFTAAERLYKGLLAAPKAPPWMKVLVQLRLCEAYGADGRISVALDSYLAVARAQPKLVANVALPEPREGDKNNRAMLAKTEAALKDAAGKPYAPNLEAFRVALLTLEGTPEQVLPIVREMRKSDDPRKRQWAVLKELEILLATGKVDEAEPLLAALAKESGDRSPGTLAFWRGRILEERKEPMAAAIEFMRVPIQYAAEDRALTAEALWRAGKAMEAAKVPPAEAKVAYKEAVTGYPGTIGAERAQRELARLGAN